MEAVAAAVAQEEGFVLVPRRAMELAVVIVAAVEGQALGPMASVRCHAGTACAAIAVVSS